MEEVTVSSAKELELVLSGSREKGLFRGQVRHYSSDGVISAVTSFDRQGCIPSEMLKWSSYATESLRPWFGERAESLDFSQAVLQHYGWRSFFLDATSNPAIAAWFACHTYKENLAVELCEDCFESPVFLRRKKADYCLEEGIGHLYILDKKRVVNSVGAIDLSELKIERVTPRFNSQSAWLVGPLKQRLSPDCFVTHIKANRSILREFASQYGIDNTENLFPDRTSDPVLNSLLSLPWIEIHHRKDKFDIPAFRRCIEVPEYHEGFRKILPPYIALYRNENTSFFDKLEKPGANARSRAFLVPSEVAFGSVNAVLDSFPEIERLALEHGSLAFELDQLFSHVEHEATSTYGKGVHIAMHSDDLFEVGEIMVDHPGMQITGAGVSSGWYYRLSNTGKWVREFHVDQCPCENHRVHQRHLEMLTIIEDWLTNPSNYQSV